MDALIEFGRGPLFRFSAAIAVLGLLRHVVLSVVGLIDVKHRAGDKRLQLGSLLVRTASRLNPLRYFVGSRRVYSILSTAFHIGLILAPIFYLGHIRLWARGTGWGWPALPGAVADGFTILTMVAAALLLLGRAWSRASRVMSRPQDWLLPLLIAAEFLSGYLLAHPAREPLSLNTTMLLHVWVGDLLLLVTPFTKIAHCALLPFSQIVAEMAWRMVPGAGLDVVKTLGKEGQPI